MTWPSALTGFIEGPNGDLGHFPSEGGHAEAYLARLATYSTVIMGRGTYEAGYAFGMSKGAAPYAGLDHHVFSTRLTLPANSTVNVVRSGWAKALTHICKDGAGDIYFCGGGRFAAFVANLGLLSVLRLKVAPVLLGGGRPLFDGLERPEGLQHLGHTEHIGGVVTAEYMVTA